MSDKKSRSASADREPTYHKITHVSHQTRDKSVHIKRDKKGRIKDFNIDFDFDHEQDFSGEFRQGKWQIKH